MNTIKQIADVFTIFHDGIIENAEIIEDAIVMTIGIGYIAELFNEGNTTMKLRLIGVKSVKYYPWVDPYIMMTDWVEIFRLKVEIINCTMDQAGRLIIQTSCSNLENYAFSGGELILKCTDYEIFDEQNNAITINELKLKSKDYWNDKFGKSS